MHAGTRIVQVIHEEKKKKKKDDDDEWKFHVLAKFEEHESMNYGSDVQPELKKKKKKKEKKKEKEKKKIVSTSFYDRRLCLWTVEI